ncbi:SH3 domain-containing protein [Saccharothrix sp. Mg75]|uniref:SH3 domain-containing protein n=1 Tax=Saccharothrix sp. Mg75 TaxID=3445357 RepID=UPI003EEB4F8E
MRTIAKLALAAVAAAMPVVALGAPAQAEPKGAGDVAARHAPCGTNGPNLDNRTASGATSGARIRTGSDAGCTARGSSQSSHVLDYYCWTVGNDGFSWTYLRNTNTGVLGWTRDDLLPIKDGVRGSNVHCGF